MFFKRINENTINFIITPEDLAERGISLDDIFERKKEAMEYLKRVIVDAARKEHFSLAGNFASLHITVMQDHTVCITLTDKAPATAAEDEAPQTKAETAQQESQESNKGEEQSRPNVFGYAFYSMEDVINCARSLADADCCYSSLYENTRDEEYDLILTRKGNGLDADFEKVVLAANEFGDFINDGPEYLAYVQEHMKCMAADNALQTLAQI